MKKDCSFNPWLVLGNPSRVPKKIRPSKKTQAEKMDRRRTRKELKFQWFLRGMLAG